MTGYESTARSSARRGMLVLCLNLILIGLGSFALFWRANAYATKIYQADWLFFARNDLFSFIIYGVLPWLAVPLAVFTYLQLRKPFHKNRWLFTLIAIAVLFALELLPWLRETPKIDLYRHIRWTTLMLGGSYLVLLLFWLGVRGGLDSEDDEWFLEEDET